MLSLARLAAWTALLAAPLFALADDPSNTTGSVFVYPSPTMASADFVFALSASPDTGDLYFHMSAPAGNSWMAVGFGTQMANALIIVAYPNSAGTGITISPRVGTGHTEPAYYDNIKCEMVNQTGLVDSNTVTNGEEHGHAVDVAMTADAVCHNATNWGTGLFTLGDEANTAQPMIFAVGPALPLFSDSLTAPLHRHEFYALFTMDLKQASSTNASVPIPNAGVAGNYTMAGATAATDGKADSDPAPFIHGAIMCLCYVFIYPIGALILRVFRRVILHIVVQCIGLVLCVMATAGGIVVSTSYNRSRHFGSAHQVIGILLILALFGQLGLGIVHHRIFKKENRPTIMGKIHLYLGPGVILFGLINAALGFNLADMNFVLRPFIAVIVIVALAFIAIRVTTGIFAKRRAAMKAGGYAGPGGSAGGEGYQYPQFGNDNRGDGALGAPPPYMQASGPQMPAFGHSAEDVQMGGLNARPGYQREVSSNSASGQVQARPMV